MALEPGGTPLPPLALVTVDGGGSYWNPHPGDNPQAMLTDELIPLCQRKGLGVGTRAIGVLGISMGENGAIALAEKYPRLIGAVAAISPAIWTSYAQAQSANTGAYASAADFTADDAVTRAAALASVPVLIASGYDDPFYPGVRALALRAAEKPWRRTRRGLLRQRLPYRSPSSTPRNRCPWAFLKGQLIVQDQIKPMAFPLPCPLVLAPNS